MPDKTPIWKLPRSGRLLLNVGYLALALWGIWLFLTDDNRVVRWMSLIGSLLLLLGLLLSWRHESRRKG